MILESLSNAIGVSGEEDDVRAIVIPAIQDRVSSLEVDAIGNVTALQSGTQYPEFTVMIAAHMDEVGMMVTAVDANGLIQFTNVGGVDARILPGLRVLVSKGRTPGVVLWKPIHKWRDMKTVPMDNLRIDVGANDKSAAEPGERIAFDSAYAEKEEKKTEKKRQ
jgi:putative aminopeptidase FrvX